MEIETEKGILLPKEVNEIIHTLQNAGFEAYAVGGCVRDLVLHRIPKDYDVTTSALPEQVKSLFRRTVDTGIEHGTVTVLLGDESFEVTTYRIDGKYEDSRHPKEVTFTASLKEDLLRRDFTINAMAYNEEEGLQDLYDGLEDLKKGVIRCVGNPMERFSEDALRIMRAVRFSAELGFEIEENTKDAIRKLALNLKDISAERIQTEMIKLVTSPNPSFLKKAWELGITAVVFPEFDICMETEQNNPHHCFSVGEHILASMNQIENDKILRLSMMLHDIGKPECKTTDEKGTDHYYGHQDVSSDMAGMILKRWKFDNKTRDAVICLTKYHDMRVELTKQAVRKAIYKVGEAYFPLLFKIQLADVLAQSSYERDQKLERIRRTKELYEEILEEGDCLSLKDLQITGKELMEIAHIPEGPTVGIIMKKLLEKVLEDPSLNHVETLLSLAMKEK